MLSIGNLYLMNPLPVQAFLPGTPGPQELIVLFIIILILFGPKRLPEIARTIGKTLDQLRKGADEFKDQVMKLDSEKHDEAKDLASSVADAYTGPDDSNYIEADADIADEAPSGEAEKDGDNKDVA